MAKRIEQEIAAAILEEPSIGFEIGGQHFSLYHPTLGQTLMTQNLLTSAGFDFDKFGENPVAEAMRVAQSKPDLVMKIIAINLLRGKEAKGEASINNLVRLLKKIGDRSEIVTLFVAVITNGHKTMKDIFKESGLQRDKQNLQKINGVKSSKNNFVFGRRTIYGQVLDAACSRYGWSLDYVLWGLSYMNLQLMLADQDSSVFLSDKELKEVHISNDREIINADDPTNRERILSMFKD